jgi:hypothetical protein
MKTTLLACTALALCALAPAAHGQPVDPPPGYGPPPGQQPYPYGPPPGPPPESGGTDGLGPSTRPFLLALDFGPSIFLLACAQGNCASQGSVTQFKLSQMFGGHPGGSGDGFGIGLHISEAFGSGLFRFQPGVRLWGDIPVSDDLGIYIAPFGHIGYALWSVSFGNASASAHLVNWGAGVGAKIVLVDRLMIQFSPLGFDFHANDDGMVWWYDLAFGLGVTF